MKRRFSGWDESPRRFYFLIIMDSRFLYKTKIFSGDSLGGMAGRIQVRRAYKKERLRLLLQGLRHKETECKNGYSNFWFALPHRFHSLDDGQTKCGMENFG